jgi:hypothetical protein
MAARATAFANDRLSGGNFEGAVREIFGAKRVTGDG